MLATVNGVGDFLLIIVVGVLWTVAGTPVAFAYSLCCSLPARGWCGSGGEGKGERKQSAS